MRWFRFNQHIGPTPWTKMMPSSAMTLRIAEGSASIKAPRRRSLTFACGSPRIWIRKSNKTAAGGAHKIRVVTDMTVAVAERRSTTGGVGFLAATSPSTARFDHHSIITPSFSRRIFHRCMKQPGNTTSALYCGVAKRPKRVLPCLRRTCRTATPHD